jgi:hypothetical protein
VQNDRWPGMKAIRGTFKEKIVDWDENDKLFLVCQRRANESANKSPKTLLNCSVKSFNRVDRCCLSMDVRVKENEFE